MRGAWLPAWAAWAGMAFPASAAPEFSLPLACGSVACIVQNYVDRDPGRDQRDYRCGPLSYDGHRGTDIRVRDLAAMARGVPVLAAAAGRVVRVREGVRDREAAEIAERDSLPANGGNTVVLDHGDGWVTLYAHLRPGSVAVRPGERVERGQALGLLGLSGRTEFPHVHFEVRHGGRVVDPFAPDHAGCVAQGPVLWDEQALRALPYRSPGLVGSGFAPSPPSRASVLRDACAPEGGLPDDPPVLVYWAQAYGLAADDTVTVRLRSAQGAVLAERATPLPRSKAVWLAYAGVRRPAGGWPPGVHRGEVIVNRGNDEVLRVVEAVCIAGEGGDGICTKEVPACSRP